MKYLAVSVLSFSAWVTAHAMAPISSGPEKTSLVELYTSEGCSSCPPAERWLSDLRSTPELWKSVVPVAFHVTYWDRLGWTDVFAQKQFTDRQYAYSRAWRSDSVYTPCFIRDGAEWKPSDEATGSRNSPGKLTVTLGEDRRAVIRFLPSKEPAETLQVWAALLVSDVESDVKRGENAGRKLRHDFTALHLVNAKLEHQPSTDGLTASVEIPDANTIPGRRALAVWVTRTNDVGPVLQAAGGWLDR